jgi:predicted phage terminase large subunit-like protein
MDIISKDGQKEIFRREFGTSLPTESRVDEIYEMNRRMARESLYFFSTAVLKWGLIEKVPHLEMCNFIQDQVRRRKLLLVPRDCYKSTIASKSFPLWVLIQEMFCGLPGLEHRILLQSFSSVNAAKQVKSIRQQIERNETFRWLFPEVMPDIARTTWTDTNLLFPREGMYGEDTIEVAGMDTHIVSRHYTIQIKDDIEDKESMESPTVRARVKSSYRAAEALFVDEQTAFDLLVGTRWGVDDVYADIIENESETYSVMCRPLVWTRDDLELDFADAKESEKPPVWNMDPDVFAPDPEKKYYFFPRLFPEASCQRLLRKQGQFMFSMIYQNNPKDPALAEFKDSDIGWFRVDQDGDLIIEHHNGEVEKLYFDTLKRVLMWDPASSDKEIKKNARNAMVVAGIDARGRVFILDSFAERRNPAFLYGKFIGLHQRWRCHKAAIEAVNFSRTLKFPLYKEQMRVGYRFPVKDQTPIGDKGSRIRTLIPYTESHDFYIRRGLKDFHEEMKNYPTFATVDLLDAAAACLDLFGAETGARDGEQKGQRRREIDQAQRLATRSGITGY